MTLIVPPLAFRVKSLVSLPSELIVELKSIVPSLAEVSKVELAVMITGPLISILLLFALAVVTVPPNLIAVSAVATKLKRLFPAPTLPLKVIVPFSPPVAPSVRVRISSPSVPVILPSKVISPPPLSSVKLPLTVTFPRNLISPEVSKLPVDPEKV